MNDYFKGVQNLFSVDAYKAMTGEITIKELNIQGH